MRTSSGSASTAPWPGLSSKGNDTRTRELFGLSLVLVATRARGCVPVYALGVYAGRQSSRVPIITGRRRLLILVLVRVSHSTPPPPPSAPERSPDARLDLRDPPANGQEHDPRTRK